MEPNTIGEDHMLQGYIKHGRVRVSPSKSEYVWFPQKDPRISPRQIIVSLSNLVRYRTIHDGRTTPLVRSCSQAAFRRWIDKWECKPKVSPL